MLLMVRISGRMPQSKSPSIHVSRNAAAGLTALAAMQQSGRFRVIDAAVWSSVFYGHILARDAFLSIGQAPVMRSVLRRPLARHRLIHSCPIRREPIGA